MNKGRLSQSVPTNYSTGAAAGVGIISVSCLFCYHYQVKKHFFVFLDLVAKQTYL